MQPVVISMAALSTEKPEYEPATYVIKEPEN